MRGNSGREKNRNTLFSDTQTCMCERKKELIYSLNSIFSQAVMKQKLLGGGTEIKRGQAASAGSL